MYTVTQLAFYYRTFSGTASACGIVAGAAALVLEKHSDYTPAEVKRYLISKATDGIIKMGVLRFLYGNKGKNKLLYVGNGMYVRLINFLYMCTKYSVGIMLY